MYNDINKEANSVIAQIEQFWGHNVTDIKIQKIADEPYSMFTLCFTLYGNKRILAEYERSTLGFYIFTGSKYVGLSKLTNESVFRGFDSYTQENIMYNFKILDKVLKSI